VTSPDEWKIKLGIIREISKIYELQLLAFYLWIKQKRQVKLEKRNRKKHLVEKQTLKVTLILQSDNLHDIRRHLRFTKHHCTKRILDEMPHNEKEVYWLPTRTSPPPHVTHF